MKANIVLNCIRLLFSIIIFTPLLCSASNSYVDSVSNSSIDSVSNSSIDSVSNSSIDSVSNSSIDSVSTDYSSSSSLPEDEFEDVIVTLNNSNNSKAKEKDFSPKKTAKRRKNMARMLKVMSVPTGLTSVDLLALASHEALRESLAISPLLDNWYKITISEEVGLDGITDVYIKKPTPAEITEISVRLTSLLANIVGAGLTATNATKEIRREYDTGKKVMAGINMGISTSKLVVVGIETAFQIKQINEIAKQIRQSKNL